MSRNPSELQREAEAAGPIYQELLEKNRRLEAEVEKWRRNAAIALSGIKDGISTDDPEFSMCVLTEALKAMEVERDRLRAALKASRPLEHYYDWSLYNAIGGPLKCVIGCPGCESERLRKEVLGE